MVTIFQKKFWNEKYDVPCGREIVLLLKPFFVNKRYISPSAPLKNIEQRSKDLFISLGFSVSKVAIISYSEVERVVKETESFFDNQLSHYNGSMPIFSKMKFDPINTIDHALRAKFWDKLDFFNEKWLDFEGQFKILLNCEQDLKISEVYDLVVYDIMQFRLTSYVYSRSFLCHEEYNSARGADIHCHDYACPAKIIPLRLNNLLFYLVTQMILGNSNRVSQGNELLDLYLKGNPPLGVRGSTLFLLVK